MSQTTITKISGVEVMFNCRYSKIGYCYPNIFIEVCEGAYIQVDLTTGWIGRMLKEHWDEWKSDAVSIDSEEGIKEYCEEIGVKYDSLCEALSNLKVIPA